MTAYRHVNISIWKYIWYLGLLCSILATIDLSLNNVQATNVSKQNVYQSLDIGAVGQAGSVALDTQGDLTIEGSGNDIWGTADGFHYAFQTLKGDGQITAHIASQEATAPWAKAGVMIRADATSNAPHVMMALTPEHSAAFLWRAMKGGVTYRVSGATKAVVPYWVRLVRVGNTFTGYISSDNKTYSRINSVTIPMGKNVYIGMAVTAHTNARLSKSVFDTIDIDRADVSHGGSGGFLSALRSRSSVPNIRNLTAEGSIDWLQIGYIGSHGVVGEDRKSGVVQQIEITDESSSGQYNNYVTGFSWTDGIPDPSATNTTTGIRTTGSGYTITVAADTTIRTLKVYLAIKGGTGVVSAMLSDSSAAVYRGTYSSVGQQELVYAFRYNASAANNTLSVHLSQLAQGHATLSLQAVTLA